MKKVGFFGAFILLLATLLVACATDTSVKPEALISKIPEEFQLEHLHVPVDWDLIGLIFVPYDELSNQGERLRRVELYFGKKANDQPLEQNINYGNVEYFVQYEEMYSILHAYTTQSGEPLESWEQMLYRLVYQDADDYDSIEVNNHKVYYHTQSKDLFFWLSADNTIQYFLHLEEEMTLEQIEEILASLVQ